ncbi:hypothetical protein EPO15_05000 [bacterium]|nr:MAG: hypothetical protein EPO15_05000 [bacterium]
MLRLRPRHGLFVLAASLFLGAASSAQAQLARYNHTMTLMADGNILIVGGKDGTNLSVQTVDIYISTGAKYETRAILNTARSSHTATLLPDGRVLVTGGVSGAATILDTGELFDPKLNTWTLIPNTNFGGPRVNHTATLLPNGKVLIAGGQTDAAGNVLTGCSLYSGGAFTLCGTGAAGAMKMARAGHTATLLHNGRVFVAGGYRAPGSGFAPTTEIYDSVGDEWFSGPAIIARAFHTATQMGNQRVLIAGGYNGVNLEENQGILASTEIYDPNSNSVTPGQPMAERKMHHTVNLLGTGNVDVYGGLGNITTSYFLGTYAFQPTSSLVVTPTGLTDGTVAGGSVLQVKPDNVMSVGATGIVVDGDINFSSPVVDASDFKVDFTYPNGTMAPIDGANIDGGKLQGQTFTLNPVGGQVHFRPQVVSSKDVDPLLAGSVLNTTAVLAPGVSTALTGGTLSGTIIVPMPVTDLGGVVVAGQATITNGSISKASVGTETGFDATLTGGVDTTLTGGPAVALDSTGSPVLTLSVSFTGITGTITNSSTTASPDNTHEANGQKLTNLQVKLEYVVSPVVATDLSFKFDIATVVVRSMIFADQERYRPDQNIWNFGVPGGNLFNHQETLLPNGDEFIYGGRRCINAGTCTAGTFSATNSRFAYIVLQEADIPWTSVGTLTKPRSNLTLSQLPDGRVLAAGGADASTTLDVAEVMNPTTRVWTATAKMKRSRSHHTATLLPNGNVLAVGGFTALGNSTGTTNHAEIYYPAPGAWVPTAVMASSRAFHATVLLPDGNPMVMGGFSNGAYLSSTEVFYSTAHRWYPGPAMPEARGQYTATVLRDGRVLVVGGLNAVSGVLATTRLFDPTTLAWAASGSLNFGRHSHTATLLRDGRVLVVGGNNGSGEISLAEIWDPVTGLWTRTTALGGNDLGIARQNHTATLLPDGKVMFVGGFTALGGAIAYNEGFDVDFSSFQMQGQFSAAEKRGDHSTLLMQDGFLLTAGGFDGLSYLDKADIMYYGASPDVVTLAGGLQRRPRVEGARPGIIAPGTPVTAVGANFKGVTEASGGGGGAANSSHAHPRVYLSRADSAAASANDSGWMVDLTSGMYTSGVNSWANMDSSVTFSVPGSQLSLPYGWYHLRVAANDQFSVSTMVLVGPQVPTSLPGIPTGLASGPSSVTWTWAKATGSFDGYSVYSATSGVFLSTVPKSGNPTETFLQRDLGPDTSALIRISAYNISGDGEAVFSTVPVLTAISLINGLQGLAQDTRSIFWSWDPVDGATGYEVYSASAGVRAAAAAGPAFTQTFLSTNTASSIQVLALMPGGPGQLSASATAYTLAASPTAGNPPMTFIATGSLVAQWLANGNPSATRYHVQMLVGTSTDPIHISSIAALNAGVIGLTPNTLHQLSVGAFNGDGRYSAFTTLGSTYTFARPPLNARIVAADPSGVALAWDSNDNPGATPYQVLYSSDNFVTDFSTHIAFSAAYTTSSTNIGSLITGKTYTFRITARNAFGQETSAASTQAFTDNGGGPAGSLALLAPSTITSSLAGTLGSGRRFEIRIPAGTFEQDTRIFVTSRAVADLHATGTGCGAAVAGFSITDLPAVQPRLPLEVGLQYIPGEAGLGSLATVAIVRYDPASNSCVPMESRVDTAANVIYGRVNHFSDFQLQQLAAGTAVATARVFPNPLYTSAQGFFTFDHLPAASHVRVFTLHGEEVFDQGANASGIVTWRAQNKVGRPVASGLYLAVIESGGEKKILKLAVVR